MSSKLLCAWLKAGKAVNRLELLKVFAETKKETRYLWSREVAFLAIDVVGSVANERWRRSCLPFKYDFEEYRKLVERIFRARGVLKTGVDARWRDGVFRAC